MTSTSGKRWHTYWEWKYWWYFSYSRFAKGWWAIYLGPLTIVRESD